MKAKEIFQALLKPDGKPVRQLVQYEAFAVQIPDPIFLYLREGSRPGVTIKDRWGVTILFPEGDPGPTPLKWRESLPYLFFALLTCCGLPSPLCSLPAHPTSFPGPTSG